MNRRQGVSAERFRDAMAHFATGVAVVTAPAPAGPHGITVNAFTSLSLDPPLVLICIERDTYSHRVLEEAGVFAVNILAAGQEDLSRFFSSATRPEGPDAFRGIAHRSGALGAPLLRGCLGSLECRLMAQYPGGDHTIFVALVEFAEVVPGRRPLVYYNRGYHGLSDAQRGGPA
jgi:flavin reductase (DIM6/NTAB) family NADH-FMN oxidoreductase RutF